MTTNTAPEKRATRIPRRFERNARLFGPEAVERLSNAHVTVFGLGGVGSWAAEGLARAGIGRLTLVDFDRVCITNVNRQLPATQLSVGAFKAEVLAERMRQINPEAQVVAFKEFYRAETSELLLPATGVDFVVDAVDNVKAKLHLLARCLELKIPVISSMGAGGRMDPSRIRVSDLYESHTDQFAKDVRKFLRIKHGIPATQQLTGILAVWSTERPRDPIEAEGEGCGFNCVCPGGENDFHSCEKRRQINGTAAFVTSVFGMMAAGEVVRRNRWGVTRGASSALV
ncbi:MAG: tRNA threonylcarbamoyladenosine dehydratase [Myxococcales bacterium]